MKPIDTQSYLGYLMKPTRSTTPGPKRINPVVLGSAAIDLLDDAKKTCATIYAIDTDEDTYAGCKAYQLPNTKRYYAFPGTRAWMILSTHHENLHNNTKETAKFCGYIDLLVGERLHIDPTGAAEYAVEEVLDFPSYEMYVLTPEDLLKEDATKVKLNNNNGALQEQQQQQKEQDKTRRQIWARVVKFHWDSNFLEIDYTNDDDGENHTIYYMVCRDGTIMKKLAQLKVGDVIVGKLYYPTFNPSNRGILFELTYNEQFAKI